MMKTTTIMAVMAVALSGTFYSAPVTAQDAPTLKLCTGLKGGNYAFVGDTAQSQLRGRVNVELVPTNGAEENLVKISKGECDAAMAQSDAVWAADESVASLGTLYTEYAHLLCNRKSGIESFSDLTKGVSVFVGPKGSGGDVTFRGLIRADKEYGGNDYEGVAPIYGDYKAAMADIREGSRGKCIFYVGSPGNALMASAEKRAADLVLVPVEDKDFNDVTYTDKSGAESSVWSPVTLDADSYGEIMPDGMGWGNADLNTIGVGAKFVVSQKWRSENIESYGDLDDAIIDVGNIVRAEKNLKLED